MTGIQVFLPHEEILNLYRLFHQGHEMQERLPELHLQLQRYLFQVLTIDEIQKLTEESV